MKKQRPLELNIIISLAIIFAIISILAFRYFIINQDNLLSNINNDYHLYLLILAYTSLIISIVQLIVAYGLFKGYFLAWKIAVIGCVLYLGSNLIFALLVYPDVFSILINIGCIFLLNKSNVKKYYKIEALS